MFTESKVMPSLKMWYFNYLSQRQKQEKANEVSNFTYTLYTTWYVRPSLIQTCLLLSLIFLRMFIAGSCHAVLPLRSVLYVDEAADLTVMVCSPCPCSLWSPCSYKNNNRRYLITQESDQPWTDNVKLLMNEKLGHGLHASALQLVFKRILLLNFALPPASGGVSPLLKRDNDL